jgi:hypothetical protein
MDLHDFGGHFSRACSKRSRARSSFVPPYKVKISFAHAHLHRKTYKSLGEFGQVDVPDLERDGEREEIHSAFVHLGPREKCQHMCIERRIWALSHLKALLVIFIFLQERCVIDDDLGVGDAKLENLIIDRLGALYRAE